MSSFDVSAFWQSEKQEHLEAVESTFATLEGPFTAALEACVASIRSGGKLIFFGNGGSAADAQHLATELTIRYKKDRAPIAAIALTTDSSALTACGNDLGFDHIFSRQLEALAKPGDIAIGISTSGNSANILNALQSAKAMQLATIGLGGKDGGQMPELCDHTLIVPANTTARIQEMHITLGHMLCESLEQKLGLV